MMWCALIRTIDIMDESLRKEREAFLQHAYKATEKVSSSKRAASSPVKSKPKKKKRTTSSKSRPATVKGESVDQMREAAQLGRRGNNPNRILKAVMDMMKERYCSGKYERLTLEEILSELKLTQLTTELRGWLLEALKHNPKIDFSSEQESFLFLPSLGGNVRNYKQLLKKLMEYDRMGLGGIPTSEIKEALSNPDKALHKLDKRGDIIRLARSDKEEVIFYNNPEYELEESVSEEFKSMWHRISVEALTEADIEKHLDLAGQKAMQGDSKKRKAPISQEKKARKKARPAKVLNTHLDSGLFKDYS